MKRTEFFLDWSPAFFAFPRSTIHPHQRQKVCFRTSRLVVPLLASAYLAFLAINHSSHAQTAAAEHVVVTGEPLPSAYGAPTSFSQSRFSPLTNAYVLPPGAVYASLIYEDAVVHFRRPDHDFTEEIELGLPYRINIATEVDVEHYGDETQVRSFSIEGRYAFANWGKIPLNPTIFAEYKVGGGRILHDEGPPTPAHKFGPGVGGPDRKSTRLNSSHRCISYAVFCLKKKK